jgi:Na+:H+ antiporter, NhaA family
MTSRGTVHPVLRPFLEFAALEASGGIVLMAATVVALLWASSPWSASYEELWKHLHFLVNDALMTVFFFVVGLEIKRELLIGELASPRRASLPIIAALGGVAVPALIYTTLNHGGPGAPGWGIPMATDIAFVIGAMALLGSRVPVGLKIFLTALAIVDDLAAVLVIALFYTGRPSWWAIGVAALCLLLLATINRLGVSHLVLYLLLGIALWLAVVQSGIHATIAGVLLAATIPSEALSRLEHIFHPWVTFFIVPLFALANAGVTLGGGIGIRHLLTEPITKGVAVGLLLGKPIGIGLASWLSVKSGLAALPAHVTFRHIHGAAWLGGIGFTMSLFIAALAFPDQGLRSDAKIGILAGSLLAGLIGYAILRRGPAPVHEKL